MILLMLFVMLFVAAPASARTLKLVALGDSLTAGYGVPSGKAFPDQLEAALRLCRDNPDKAAEIARVALGSKPPQAAASVEAAGERV